ncbi:MAG: PEP-CTERM sorting domain-containing protein [Fimbriimonadaceae bacterium]
MLNSKTLLIAGVLLVAASANATFFDDANGDQGPTNGGGPGFTHLDIDSVTVTNTATTITFAFAITGDIAATNWGKYGVFIRDTNNAVVDTNTSNNGWGRNGTLAGGTTAWIGSWVDGGGGAQNWLYNGAWSTTTNASVTLGQFSTSITANLADLGLVFGDTIIFDAVSTAGGGTDTITDSLTGATPAEWSDNVVMQGLTYSTNPVPEPATMTILAGAAGLAALRRRKK